MNYLAHLYLADADPEAWVGNLMGDFAKGQLPESLPPAIRRGIVLHRRIDAFSDAHPCFIASKRRIQPAFRRYGGILVDIFYDHFLARDWETYSPVPLRHFALAVYQALRTYYDCLPAPMQRSVSYMIAHDLLLSYREVTGVDRALRGIEGRLKRPSQLGQAGVELERHYPALRADFTAFFPELIAFVQTQKEPLEKATAEEKSDR